MFCGSSVRVPIVVAVHGCVLRLPLAFLTHTGLQTCPPGPQGAATSVLIGAQCSYYYGALGHS